MGWDVVCETVLNGVPIVSGIVLGSAAKKYQLKITHDSVLRRAFVDDEGHHNRVRVGFAGVVNGKKKYMDADGLEHGIIGKQTKFYAIITLLVLPMLVIPELITGNAALAALDIRMFVGAAAMVVWLLSSYRLWRNYHSCFVELHIEDVPGQYRRGARAYLRDRTSDDAEEDDDDSEEDEDEDDTDQVWIRLTADRAEEDWLPTKNIEHDFLGRRPSWISRELL